MLFESHTEFRDLIIFVSIFTCYCAQIWLTSANGKKLLFSIISFSQCHLFLYMSGIGH